MIEIYLAKTYLSVRSYNVPRSVIHHHQIAIDDEKDRRCVPSLLPHDLYFFAKRDDVFVENKRYIEKLAVSESRIWEY